MTILALPPDGMAVKRRLHARLVAEADVTRLSRLPRPQLMEQVRVQSTRLLAEEGLAFNGRQREALVEAVVSELAGLGPLEPLLQDAGVTEIMVNGPAQVFAEREGRLQRVDTAFDDAAHLMRIIERILSPLGRRVDESSPMCDGRLADGSPVSKVYYHKRQFWQFGVPNWLLLVIYY